MARGPIYEAENKIPKSDDEMFGQLADAMQALELRMRANVPITKGNSSGVRTIGFGVNRIQRGIAADTVISIAKAIKALKGW